MYPLVHIALSLIFTLILKLFSIFTLNQLVIIFLSSFLVDIDHWFVYVSKTGKLGVIGSYKWFISLEKLKKKPKFLFVFHTIEFFLILILLGTKYQIFQFILMGALFHMFLDIADSIVKKEYWKYLSIIYWILKKH